MEKGLPAHEPDYPFASAIIDPDLRGGVERDFRPVGKLKRSLLADPGPVTIARDPHRWAGALFGDKGFAARLPILWRRLPDKQQCRDDRCGERAEIGRASCRERVCQ